MFDTRCSMLDARCSMLDARCSMLDAVKSSMIVLRCQEAVRYFSIFLFDPLNRVGGWVEYPVSRDEYRKMGNPYTDPTRPAR
jgi:hypothetical protein